MRLKRGMEKNPYLFFYSFSCDRKVVWQLKIKSPSGLYEKRFQ